MYDPRIGRWLQEDPIEFKAEDSNLYRYVGNAPTNATDPSGEVIYFRSGTDFQRYMDFFRQFDVAVSVRLVPGESIGAPGPEYAVPMVSPGQVQAVNRRDSDDEFTRELLHYLICPQHAAELSFDGEAFHLTPRNMTDAQLTAAMRNNGASFFQPPLPLMGAGRPTGAFDQRVNRTMTMVVGVYTTTYNTMAVVGNLALAGRGVFQVCQAVLAARVAAVVRIAGLTQAEISALVQSSGARVVRVFTNQTSRPQVGRQLSAALERELAAAVPRQGEIFVGEIPLDLFRRLEADLLIRRARTLMGGVQGTEIIFSAEAMRILARFFR